MYRLNYKILFSTLSILLIATMITSFWVYRDRSRVPEEFTPGGTPLPIIMYHSVSSDPARLSDWVISPETLEQDLIYLKERGYTPIFVSDLIAFTNGEAMLPEHPIILSFDDGYLDNLTNAAPLLEKHGMKAELAVVGRYLDTYSREGISDADKYADTAFLSWEDAKSLSDRGVFEIISHSYDLHSEETDKINFKSTSKEAIEEYRSILREDVQKMQSDLETHLGKALPIFSYPHGKTAKYTNDVLADLGFQALFTDTRGGINYISMNNKNSLLHLRRINRPNGMQSAQFFRPIDAICLT